MKQFDGVIFDWAGTTVDYGCFAPVKAFFDTFAYYNIDVTMDEVRKPMGMRKRDHIKTMLSMPRINKQWIEQNGRPWSEMDLDIMNSQFEVKLMGGLEFYTDVKPHVLEVVDELKKRGVKIGSTTGYTAEMMKTVREKAEKSGYKPDACLTPDMVDQMGRPHPYMIFRNMQELGLPDVRRVLKVGDTVSDIQEGKNAGIYTAGIIEGSSELGLSQDEYESLSPRRKQQEIHRVTQTYEEAGADFIFMNMQDVLAVI